MQNGRAEGSPSTRESPGAASPRIKNAWESGKCSRRAATHWNRGEPSGSQALDRLAYMLNNSLRYNDASGLCIRKPWFCQMETLVKLAVAWLIGMGVMLTYVFLRKTGRLTPNGATILGAVAGILLSVVYGGPDYEPLYSVLITGMLTTFIMAITFRLMVAAIVSTSARDDRRPDR